MNQINPLSKHHLCQPHDNGMTDLVEDRNGKSWVWITIHSTAGVKSVMSERHIDIPGLDPYLDVKRLLADKTRTDIRRLNEAFHRIYRALGLERGWR